MTSAQRRWLDQWKGAGIALEEQRRLELQALTHDRALAATEALLTVGRPGEIPEHRRTYSGLVQQQALFHHRLLP